MTKRRHFFKAAVAAACALVLGACSSYVGQSALIKQALVDADYDDALERIESIDKSSSELLYLYEKGLVLHYQNRFAESNEALEQAEVLLEELYTKSVTRELAALAIADQVAKYRGDPHEAVLVNYYKILNYLYLGDVDGAAIECRRVNRKLQAIRDAGDDYFENDPFLQYLTALVYEESGDRGEAEVSYRVAVQSYDDLSDAYAVKAPGFIFCDAADNARSFGDAEAFEAYAARSDCDSMTSDVKSGRINILLECGYVTHKEEASINLPIYTDDDWDDNKKFAVELSGRRGHNARRGVKVDYWLRVAMPVLAVNPPTVSSAMIDARVGESGAAVRSAAAVPVENVSALAELAFHEKEGKILLRSIVRALAKYAAKKGADSKDEALGWLVNIVGAATETADTRSWSTLPGRILMARMDLPVGTYDLHVKLDGSNETEFIIPSVTVRPGRTTFLNHRIY